MTLTWAKQSSERRRFELALRLAARLAARLALRLAALKGMAAGPGRPAGRAAEPVVGIDQHAQQAHELGRCALG